ncbi:hypothetical protein Tco_1474164 [Tanacetum coccineum]
MHPILSIAVDQRVVVYCDTSNQGLGCVLMQRGKVENATTEMLCSLDQLMERKEGGVIIRVFNVLRLKHYLEGNVGRLVEVGDKVMLEVSSWKDVLHFGKVRPVCHHDMWEPYWTDANLHVHLEKIKVDKTLRFAEESVKIIDREVKSLKRSRIPIVKSIRTRSESCYAVLFGLVMAAAKLAATIDFPQQIQDRILESQLVDDLKMKLSGMQEENDKLKRVSIKSSQLLEYEKLLEYDGSKSSFSSIDHPLNDGTSSSSSDTKISHLPTSLVDKALTISRTYDVTDALDSPERPGPMDWQNLMSGQPATSTWNSLDEQSFLQGVALTIPKRWGFSSSSDTKISSSERLGPLDWDNLMSRQLTTGTSNSLDEQRGVLRLQSAGHVILTQMLAATKISRETDITQKDEKQSQKRQNWARNGKV